eukprot:CAMPEP_0174348288 /NCGR_PEP_ID=MMETSP0811_2-20130205/4693_1 /TAXON_ID=73025 ORGANISM="Eutreptiella gymnastica-like, Strain CCMP1594" /NCGR_SAMPLE_ID=MMETSP0811_2 /ASSEMBLY_ACC=CAM_ASM_000667 /LENGTH=33 /DNA_ID= /DNA_START= /DNA_END= /DNA_ORIENTATION=
MADIPNHIVRLKVQIIQQTAALQGALSNCTRGH